MALRTTLLRDRGFSRCIAVATGSRSQQCHAALGASRVYSIGYREFTSTRVQERPFRALSGQSCVLMLKELQPLMACSTPLHRMSLNPLFTATAAHSRLDVPLAA
jgi:hypothetical protein